MSFSLSTPITFAPLPHQTAAEARDPVGVTNKKRTGHAVNPSGSTSSSLPLQKQKRQKETKKRRHRPLTEKGQAAKERFFKKMEADGVTVVGEYVGTMTKIDVICAGGHPRRVLPHNAIRCGVCRTCSAKVRKSDVAKRVINSAEFTYLIEEEQGGQVAGPYVNYMTPIDCFCAEGQRTKGKPVQFALKNIDLVQLPEPGLFASPHRYGFRLWRLQIASNNIVIPVPFRDVIKNGGEASYAKLLLVDTLPSTI